MRRFVALHQSEEAAELLKRHPNAFLLLTQIALRARWTDCRITGLKPGQALIGDWKAAGLRSVMAYKFAKQTLEKLGFAAFQGTNKGTIATLCDSTIYSVTSEASNQPANHRATTEQPSSSHQAATNHSEHSEHSDTHSFAPPSAEAEQESASPDSPPPEKIHWSPAAGWTGIATGDLNRFAKAYPAVTIDTALTRADLWLRANPAKAKKVNWRRFLTNWLARDQEGGGDKPSVRPRNPNRILPV